MRPFTNCRSQEGRCRPTSIAGKILFFGGHAVLAVVVVCAVAILFGWVVQLAWNASLPTLFNLPVITFWQAVALMVLGRVLTGRLHHHRGGCGKHKRHPKAGCCGRHDKDRAAPPSGDLYAQWWWEEGETAFKAYRSRQIPDDQSAQEPERS